MNWNAGALLLRCIESLEQVGSQLASRPEVIVVDNASTDGSVDHLRGDDRYKVILNAENRGFGRACNQGAQLATGDLLLFLNPDCVLAKGSVEACIKELECDPTVGVVGIALRDETGHIARTCHRLPELRHFVARVVGLSRLTRLGLDSAMTEWKHDSDSDVDHVIGAFYMMRADLFRRLHGFDERFFVYFEDLDLSLRIRRAGYRIRFVARPSSYHKQGGSSEQIKAKRLFYSIRSQTLYAFKHFKPSHAAVYLAVALTVEPLTRVVERSVRGKFSDVPEVLQAFLLLYRDLPDIFRRIRQP